MKISKKSWHFRLAAMFCDDVKYAGTRMYSPINFCTYFWSVVLSAILLTVITVLLAFIEASFVDFCVWVYVNLFIGHAELHALGDAAAGLLIGAAILFLGLNISFVVGKLRYRLRTSAAEQGKEETSGFFVMAYEKFKTKTCFKVELSD